MYKTTPINKIYQVVGLLHDLLRTKVKYLAMAFHSILCRVGESNNFLT